MDFSESGSDALGRLADQAYDVVVSDLRMPAMDGAEFLEQAARLQPDTLRIVLSGYAELDLAAKSARAAHQFLAKPCALESLKDIIVRASALRQRLGNAELRAFVEGASSLPSLPQLYDELVSKLADENACIADLGEIIGRDISMSAKILQLVNSAFFGLGSKVDSIDRAVVLLGADLLKTLVLAAELVTAFEDGANAEEIGDIWDHALLASRGANLIAKALSEHEHVVDQTTTAALLQDIGRVLLMSQTPAATHDGNDTDANGVAFTHGEIGGYLLSLWGLPDPVVEAVVSARDDTACGTLSLSPCFIVRLTNLLLADDRPAAESLFARLDAPGVEFDMTIDAISSMTA